MSEFTEINEKAERARAQRAAEEAAEQAALNEWKEKVERARIRRRKRATQGLVFRAAMVIVAGSALMGAESAGLIDFRLVSTMITALVSWLAVWVGGWAQFMFAEEGLFRWRN